MEELIIRVIYLFIFIFYGGKDVVSAVPHELVS